MGLSDEERIKNIICCVDALTDIEPFTLDPNDSKPQQINEILKDLWFDLFGRDGNSFHWFGGSSSDNSLLKAEDPFGLAIILSHEKSSDFKSEQSLNDFADKAFEPGTKEWFEYRDNYMPTSLSLLKHHYSYSNRQNHAHDILAIYKYIENYYYNVNRYDDALSKSLEPLTKKISRLKGLCFKVISNDPIFWKAYAAGIVFKFLLTSHIDNINKWFKDNHMHHSIRLNKISDEDLFKAISLAQKTSHDSEFKPFSANNRLVLILKFCGSKFHYDHEHKKLFKLIEKHNEEFSKDKINLKQIKKICDKAIKDHAEQDKENRTDKNWSCDLTGESFYKNDKEYQKLLKDPKPKKNKES